MRSRSSPRRRSRRLIGPAAGPDGRLGRQRSAPSVAAARSRRARSGRAMLAGTSGRERHRDPDRSARATRRPSAVRVAQRVPGRLRRARRGWRRSRRPASRSSRRRRRARGEVREPIRSSSSNVRPSAIPTSASDQRGSSSTGPRRPLRRRSRSPSGRAPRLGLLTILVPSGEASARARRRGSAAAARPAAAERRVRPSAVALTRPGGRRRGGRGSAQPRGSPATRSPSSGPATPADSNVAMPSRTRDRGGDQAHRQRRAGPLPQPQVEVEERIAGRAARGRPRGPARSSGGRRSAAAPRWRRVRPPRGPPRR